MTSNTYRINSRAPFAIVYDILRVVLPLVVVLVAFVAFCGFIIFLDDITSGLNQRPTACVVAHNGGEVCGPLVER